MRLVGCDPLHHCDSNFYIVDDDESVRNALARLLRAEGLESRTFPTAESFLQFLENAPLEHRDRGGCAIVDFHLPGMNGVELATFLKRQYPRIHTVLITGTPDAHLDGVAAKAGVVLLHKPIGDELFEAIASPPSLETGPDSRSTPAGPAGSA